MGLTLEKTPQIKQGAAVGGWVCFGLGFLFMYWSLFLFFIYGPLFFVAFILAIVAMSQGRIVGGISLLLLTLVAPLTLWLMLGVMRTGAVLNKANDFLTEENRKHGIIVPQIGPDGQFHYPSPPVTAATPAPPAAATSAPAAATTGSPAGPAFPPFAARDAEAIAQCYQEDIANAEAATLEIAVTTRLPPCRNFESRAMSYSPDGRSVLYVLAQPTGTPDRLVAYSLLTGQLLRSHVLNARSENVSLLAWSADGKRAMIQGNGLTVVDLDTDKEIALPPIQTPSASGLLWRTDGEVLFVGDDGVHALNLDTLKVSLQSRYPERSDRETEARRVVIRPFQLPKTILGTGNFDRHSYVGAIDRKPITARPTPYQRLLMPDPGVSLLVSPDTHCLLLNRPSELTVCYLGLQPAPRRDYWIALDNAATLTPAQDRERLASLQTNKVIRGTVYAPQLNPLNNKPIGPNKELYKGQVIVSRWHEHSAEVLVRNEVLAFRPGDVVADLETAGEGWAGSSFSYPSEVWKPLMFDTPPADDPAAPDPNEKSTTPGPEPGHTRTALRSEATPGASLPSALPDATPPPARSDWQGAVKSFATAYTNAWLSSNVERTVANFAPTVDYYDEGKVNQSRVRADYSYYNERWPVRRGNLVGEISVAALPPDLGYSASYRFALTVESPARRERIVGEYAIEMHVAMAADGPKIVYIREKTLHKTKEALPGPGGTPPPARAMHGAIQMATTSPCAGQWQGALDATASASGRTLHAPVHISIDASGRSGVVSFLLPEGGSVDMPLTGSWAGNRVQLAGMVNVPYDRENVHMTMNATDANHATVNLRRDTSNGGWVVFDGTVSR